MVKLIPLPTITLEITPETAHGVPAGILMKYCALLLVPVAAEDNVSVALLMAVIVCPPGSPEPLIVAPDPTSKAVGASGQVTFEENTNAVIPAVALPPVAALEAGSNCAGIGSCPIYH